MNARQQLDNDHARGRHVAVPQPDKCFGCAYMRHVARIEPRRVIAPYGPSMTHLSRDGVTLCGRRSSTWDVVTFDHQSKCIRCWRQRNAEKDMVSV